jgi:hypothetical protein
LRPWPGADLAAVAPRQPVGARLLLTAVALLTYLLLLLTERGRLNRLSYIIIIILLKPIQHPIQQAHKIRFSQPSSP